jgi:5-methylcytosine-specific restriction protein B
MLFDKVTQDHILQAIQEIDEKGIEKGAHSSTYDVVYNNKRYPPKLVVSLANKYANGEILPRNTFDGGDGTPAFQLLKRLGLQIDKKTTMNNQKLYDLKDSFLKEWPLERLKTMTLEEYTNLDKTSFCYWIEHITRDLGSVA